MRYLFNSPNSSEANLSASARSPIALTNPIAETNCSAERKKQQVASQFSRASGSYDTAARIQQYAAQQLIQQLPTASGHWLDLGSGTGYAVKPLLKQGADRVTGLDLSEGMVEYSRSKLAHKPFTALVGDAENLPFEADSFDGIYSNLMIQWSEQPECLFSQAAKVLKPGSLFAFTTLGPRTMHELKSAWSSVDPFVHVNTFKNKDTVLDAFAQHFDIQHVRQQEYVQMHPSLKALLKELKAIGATNVNSGRRSGLGGRERLRQLDNAYPRHCHSNSLDKAGQFNCSRELEQLPLTYDLIWAIGKVKTSV